MLRRPHRCLREGGAVKDIVFDADPKLVQKLEQTPVINLVHLAEQLHAEAMNIELTTTEGEWTLTIKRKGKKS